MRIISTKVHGILDYVVGVLLIAAPWLFGFADEAPNAATWVPVVLGIGAIGYSMLTNYEYGVWKAIPMPTHLTFDVLSGIFLAASPWLFNFDDTVYMPHLVVGIFEVLAGLMTERVPYRKGGVDTLNVRTDERAARLR